MCFFQVRATKYLPSRALKLIEAISKDLSTQLLKVLSTQRLMLASFEDFEKTTKLCATVFQTWDDEYEKLLNVLRRMCKHNFREMEKLMRRSIPLHKRLEIRLGAMKE